MAACLAIAEIPSAKVPLYAPPPSVCTLYDMVKFIPEMVVDFLPWLNAIEIRLSDEKRETTAHPDVVLQIYAKVGVLQGLADYHEMKSISDQCKRIVKNLESKSMAISCGEMRDDLRDLRRRCEDDLKSIFLYQLNAKQGDMFENPRRDWDPIIGRFYKIKHNVEESSRCFSLERYGASVFHILLVAEYGVIQIADLLDVSGDKPGWGSLERLKRIVDKPHDKRSDLENKHYKLLTNTVPLAIVVKDSWRHKMDHVDNQIVWINTDFSPKVAEEIIAATRGFMRKLATELPE